MESRPYPWASEIASLVGGRLVGTDVELRGACSLGRPQAGRLGFATSQARLGEADPTARGVVLLATPELEGRLAGPHILVDEPRLAFARAMARYFPAARAQGIAATARIDPSAQLGAGVVIGEYCVVGAGAQIGDHTELRHHVVVGPRVRIGVGCLIKSGTVVGEEGFGFVLRPNGEHVRIEHIGGVTIGDHVELGALNTVTAGAIDATEVHDHVKTDDHVHIAHNCIVGRGSILTACAELSGSVTLGEQVWVGPNSSIMDAVSIGRGAFIGLGSVVTRDLEGGRIYAGVPARARGPRPGFEADLGVRPGD